MEANQDEALSGKSVSNLSDLTYKACERPCEAHVECEKGGLGKKSVSVTSSVNVPSIYREDVVRSNVSDMIGIVTEVSGDSDSDSSDSDYDDSDDDEDNNENEAGKIEENDEGEDGTHRSVNKSKGDNDYHDNLPADQVRVTWIDDSETTQKLGDVTVIDRGFLHGDFVAAASDPTGQVGLVVDVNITVDLVAPDGSVTKDVSSKDLKRISEFTVGDHVVLGPWLGRVDDVLDNVTVLFDDGCMCKVTKADPSRLKPVGKSSLEDAQFPYYPGQRVKANTSSFFKNAKWLSGSWKANRLEGTVTKVTVGSVFIYWIASAGYGPDSSTAPAEEQSPKNLRLISCFSHANWQLGDWCFPPSSAIPMDGDFSKVTLHPMKSDSNSAQGRSDSDHKGTLQEPIRDSGCGGLDAVIAVDKSDTDSESQLSSKSNYCGNSLAVVKEPAHETWPIHRKKIRKIAVRRDKKTRKKEETFERALMITNTKTRVDVAWQDGKIEYGYESVNLIPIDTPGDHDFGPEQYVVEKSSLEINDTYEIKRTGVVRSVNAKEKTACVRWLKYVSCADDPREFDNEEIVSVYELEGHPDYDYCYGDIVVRLTPVSVSTHIGLPADIAEGSKETTAGPNGVNENLNEQKQSKIEDTSRSRAENMKFSDLSWVGSITGLRDGDIEVTWADGMVSTVGPQAVYVVGRDDDESIGGGSESSDDAASWETVVDDDEIDALVNAEHDTGLQSSTNVNLETGERNEAGENISGRNGALSFPLLALGFVTKLATGIFSRRGRHTEPVPGALESDMLSQGTAMVPEDGSSNKESISELLDSLNVSGSQANQGVTHDAEFPEAKNLEAAEEGLNVKADELNGPSCDADDHSTFKRFDTAKDPSDHYFLGATRQNNARKWLKKVQQDWSILQNNLPDGIFVRVYEDRMDVLRAVIVGAYGTPYQDGLFFFDFHLPSAYPDVPPSAHYRSGGWRINPNLYEEGKVCLSLLNTWAGRGNEVWDPLSSSILQVLVSLQGLVLNSKPYFNEAGYDKQVGTAEGEKNSLSYNENTFLLNCKTMMYLMRKPPKDFEDLIKEHFRKRGYFILKACDAYMKGCLIGSLTEDASTNLISNEDATSVGFKLMLAKIVPKLYIALDDVGANCQEFKHLL